MDAWSEIAQGWAGLWGRFAEPVWDVAVAEAGIGRGTRVLDVGCGSGEFLAYVTRLGALAAGVDPAEGMLAIARATGADVRRGDAGSLPWPDGTFDVVTAVNVLQLAEDPVAALAESGRVGRLVVVAGWAEGRRNDFDVVEAAVSLAADEEPREDGELRLSGGFERVAKQAGLDVLKAGLVEVPWRAPDDATLVSGVLLGEDPATIAATASTVIEAARPFRTEDGGYRLVNAFRYAVARSA
ncbi:MAG: methyltransferase domain-containing protein [Kibdelosporangium sp.]